MFQEHVLKECYKTTTNTVAQPTRGDIRNSFLTY